MKIAEFAREREIEIIHAHVARDYIPASIACLAAKPAKFVLTRHVLFALKPFNKFALKNLSRAIGVSEAVCKELRAVFPQDKVTVIPNGLDVSSADEAESRKEFRSFHGIPPDAPVVGTLGELKELKGQRDFLLAANEIARKNPDCRFVIVGKDNSRDKAFRRELKRLVQVFGLTDRFLFLDWLDDTAPFFAAIDVFVSPSHSESFGLAILEAMARGKAIVATDTEGAKEQLGANGLVQVKEPLELARAIENLLANEDLRREFGERNRQTASEKFPLSRMIDLTETVYSEVVDGNYVRNN